MRGEGLAKTKLSFLKKPDLSSISDHEEGGVKNPKIWPHDLWMTPWRFFFSFFQTEIIKKTMWNHIIIFCTLWSHLYGTIPSEEDELRHHKRTKRFLWMTHEKRLVLPVIINSPVICILNIIIFNISFLYIPSKPVFKFFYLITFKVVTLNTKCYVINFFEWWSDSIL